jgi:hypothetical protein
MTNADKDQARRGDIDERNKRRHRRHRHDKDERALLIEREAGNEETGAKGSLAEGSLP